MSKSVFTLCVEFMKAWSEQNGKYIERWSTEHGRLAFFVTGETEEKIFPLSVVCGKGEV